MDAHNHIGPLFNFDNTFSQNLEGFFVNCQPEPASAPKLLQFNYALAEELGLDAALTSRYLEENQSSGLDKGSNSLIISLQIFLTRILNRLTSRQAQANVTDWTSGYLAIRREIFNSYELSGSHGDYYMHLMYHLISKGYRFEEIPYSLEKRKFGESKTTESFLKFFINGIGYLSTLFQIWRGQRASPVNTTTRLNKKTND